ncbi:MAG: hypothetical protein ABFS35_22745 [Bacteroidota bacterium]
MKKNYHILIKHIAISSFLSLVLLTASGQEKNSFQVSGIIAQYQKIEERKFSPVPGYYHFPLSPGVEIKYSRQIADGMTIGTGINYQKGNVSSVFRTQNRFHFTEVSVPVLIRKSFRFKNQKLYYFSTGVYWGKMTQVTKDYYTSFGWREHPNIETTPYYSDDISFSDLYLDFGYIKPLNPKFDLSFSPWIKYRLNTTWLNHHHKKIHCGIKIIVGLKF